MKIKNVEYKVVEMKERVSFVISGQFMEESETVFVKITTDNGLIGYGEAKPSRRATSESIATVTSYLEDLKPHIIGRDPYDIEGLHELMNWVSQGNTSAKAAIDIACYDVCAKNAQKPLYRYLGGTTNLVITDMSIGIDKPEIMANLAMKYVKDGFKILKVKVGNNIEDDLRAIKLIREAVGPDIDIRLDANQGWKLKEAIKILGQMEELGVEEVEQPLQKDKLAQTKILRSKVTQVVMVDEAVASPKDAIRYVKADACDMINIKLMKSAGIFPALKINDIAEADGIECMVGCMSESRIGIAAGAALVASRKNISYADLDSHLLTQEVPGLSSNFKQEGGHIYLSDEPGLGITVENF